MLTEKELQVLTRRAHGESQQAIAKALGISQAAISQFETNAHKKVLEAERLTSIVKELGIQTEKGLVGTRVTYGGGKR